MAIFLRYARQREKNESGCTNNPDVYLLKGVTFGSKRQAKSAFAAGASGRENNSTVWGNEPLADMPMTPYRLVGSRENQKYL
jgi:hypothetical protein